MARSRSDICGKGHSLEDAFVDKRGILQCRACNLARTRKRLGIAPERFGKRGRFPKRTHIRETAQ